MKAYPFFRLRDIQEPHKMAKPKKQSAMDPNLYNKQMTMRPKRKIRRKNKNTRLQELWNEGKETTEEFYTELTKFIKSRLMQDLIRRGYYVNGKRQTSFTRDEWDSCYTHVLHKIIHEYKPEKGTIATYIRWQIRGWGQLIIQKQVRKRKYLPKGTVSLDNTNIYNVKLEEYKNSCKCPDDIEDVIDNEYFQSTMLDTLDKDDISHIRDSIREVGEAKPYFGWLDF